MDIQNAQLQLSANSQQRFALSTREQVTILQAESSNNEVPNNTDTPTTPRSKPTISSTPTTTPIHLTRAPADELRLTLVSQIYERLTGKQMHMFNMPNDATEQETVSTHEEMLTLEITAGQQPQMQEVRIQTETLLHRAEQVIFNAHGVVETRQGEKIHFNLDMQLSRETVERLDIDVSTAFRQLKDPLVINFDSHTPELSAKKIQFDIDADGKTDNISQLKSGSGYIALDKNSDGLINNGRELFGALSGNGFNDLSAYDENNDGRIDSNDSIYNELKIWVQEGPKGSELLSLKDKGIDTLFLAHAPTPFELYANNGHQEPQGVIRSTSVYLSDNGQVGTLQQIDLFT